MIEVSNLTVAINDNTLLSNISLGFNAGQLNVIVGPNGAGKTTLLKCIDGEIVPTSGNIQIDGKLLNHWSDLDLARMRGVLPQHSSLDFPFTVEDVVLMGRIPQPTSDGQNRDIAQQALEVCDCGELITRSYTSLSGGEQQRVQTARVFAQVWDKYGGLNRYLLLDEPVSALDLSHQYGLMKNLKNFAENQNIGIICTLHNLNLAAQFAARSIVLDRGLVVADGRPQDVFTEETLSNVFNLDVRVSGHPEDDRVPLIIPKLDGSK